MGNVIFSALLPIVITFLLGISAAWRHDFGADQAQSLNKMVMNYALPLTLFAGIMSIAKDSLTEQFTLFIIVLLAMMTAFLATIVIARYVFKRDIMTSALQGLAIGGPAVPFVGVSVLGYLFAKNSAIPIATASITMNVLQVPVTMMLLSYGASQKKGASQSSPPPPVMSHVIHAFRQPVCWAPVLALVLLLAGIRLPKSLHLSMTLLGQATGGVALFASGIILFYQKIALNLPVITSIVFRNIIVPLALWGILLLTGLPHELVEESVITMAIPVASIVIILAVEYHIAEKEMASTLFVSTVISFITIAGFMLLTMR